MSQGVRCSRCGASFSGAENRFDGICPRCLAEIALTPEPPPLRIGTVFRGMEIVQILGEGGMGVVYKARQVDLGRWVALKVLSPRLAVATEFAQRFQREAKVLAALDHPGIVRVIDYGHDGDLFFLTMEYVDGLPLRELIRTSRLAPKEALAFIPQICEALEYAHSVGVVHRDIKPENLLVDRKGKVKIADFGLAKMQATEALGRTRTNVAMGTPQYMAPEQFEDVKGVDHRADIYSLGIVFYEMLTGELPMGKFDPPSKRIVVDVRLDEVVLKAMERDRDRRYQRVRDVRTDVETIATSPRADARPTRRRIWGAAAMGGVLGIGALVVALSWKTTPPAPGESGDPFQKMQERIERARSLQVGFQTESWETGARRTSWGAFVVGDGNKVHARREGFQAISDGASLYVGGTSSSVPGDLARRLLTSFVYLGAAETLLLWEEEPGAVLSFRVRDWKPEARPEEIGYCVRVDGLSGGPREYQCKLWIRGGLPEKRWIGTESGGRKHGLSEAYQPLKVDEAVDPSLFRRPE